MAKVTKNHYVQCGRDYGYDHEYTYEYPDPFATAIAAEKFIDEVEALAKAHTHDDGRVWGAGCPGPHRVVIKTWRNGQWDVMEIAR